MKNLGRKMPQTDMREGSALHSNSVVLQLLSHSRATDTAKDRPLTPHFIVTVPRGPMVSNARVLNSPCGLRTTEET